MCVNQLAMVPSVVNMVTSKGKDTYTTLISDLTCFKCRNVSSSEKDFDSEYRKNFTETIRENSQNILRKWGKCPPFNGSEKSTNNKGCFPLNECSENHMSLLNFFAINALELSAPATDILLKGRSSDWFQLSGHPDSFTPAGPGTVWKKRANPNDDTEKIVYEELSKDPLLSEIIPKFYREVEKNGDKYIELQDLLYGFQEPYVMDVKMGTRTFLESEVKNCKARNDLYQKMIAIDPSAITEEENNQKAVTKLRYMQFRELQSSTCSHGFRIEAIKSRGKPPVTDLKKVKSADEVKNTFRIFLNGKENVRQRILSRVREIRERIDKSEYFKTREVVGSSLFIIYDDYKVGVWLIDFAKTNKLPEGMTINHRSPWQCGNHEEGLLFGFDTLISVIESLE